MPRRNWGDGQEFVLEDLNALSAAVQREVYDRLAYELLQRAENAFFGDSFSVLYSSANTIVVKKGLGFQTDSNQASPEPNRRPVYLEEDTSANVDTPDVSNNRIDIVCVKAAIVDELTATRRVKEADSDEVNNESLVVQKDWSAEIEVVTGTPASSPSAPATPSGYIKIAEILVTAVTGIANQDAITDSRTQLPVGALTTVNTLGYSRLTAGASTSLTTLFADIDSLLKNGNFEFTDLKEMGSDPDSPGASKQRLFYRDGVLYLKNSSGVKTPVGSGGGGGGSLKWNAPAGDAPIDDVENDQEVFFFQEGLSQRLVAFIKVPEGYISGRQIKMFLGAYSPASSDEFRLQTTTTLIRKNQDSVSSTTNQHVDNTGDVTNSVANQFRNLSLNLSDADGLVNSVGVSSGDLLKVELKRIAVNDGTDDSEDTRFIPSSTEVKFG